MKEGSENSKGPWSRGDEFEKLLGPEEVRRIRERTAHEALVRQGVRQQQGFVEDMQSRVLENFREDLEISGGSFTHTLTMDDTGRIADPGDFNGPDIFSCSPSYVSREGDGIRYWFTPDSLREGALNIHTKYPDIIFTFEEDRTKRVFSYTARFEKKE